MIDRPADWPERLADALEAADASPFVYGQDDCCLFAANVVLAMTGEDVGAPFRGRYATRQEAMTVLEAFAGGGIAEAIARLAADWRAERVRPGFGQRGDVALLGRNDAAMMGVIDMTACHIAMKGSDGLKYRPIADAVAIYRF